jgi:hypothetical protein
VTYLITAAVSVEGRDGYRTVYQTPAFFLESDVQGIVNAEHARRIVERMLMAGRNPRTTTVEVCAMETVSPMVRDAIDWLAKKDDEERERRRFALTGSSAEGAR